jgi:protein-S-isoprenylcysteine O-methyltransferase Ste14
MNGTTPQPADHAKVVGYPPLIATAFAALGGIVHWLWPLPVAPRPVAWTLAGIVALTSMCLALWGVWQLKRAGTAIDPYGSSIAIVTSGPYAFSRNPLYVAIGLLFAAIGLGFNSVAILAMIPPWLVVMHFGVVLREERYLAAKFGATYTAYQERVRRWL